MDKLTPEQSARAIFALCSDVSKVDVKGRLYYYFDARNVSDLMIVRYILRKNGLSSARFHKTRYYARSTSKELVVRALASDLDRAGISEFRMLFRKLYKDSSSVFVENKKLSDDNKRSCFVLWSASKKAAFINEIANKTR